MNHIVRKDMIYPNYILSGNGHFGYEAKTFLRVLHEGEYYMKPFKTHLCDTPLQALTELMEKVYIFQVLGEIRPDLMMADDITPVEPKDDTQISEIDRIKTMLDIAGNLRT